MKKSVKVLAVVVSLLTMFALVGCDQSNELAEYKTDAKAEITNHIATLSADDYTSENWVLVGQKVTEGKAAVDIATNKNEVDTAKAAAITAIGDVPQREEVTMQRQAKQTYLEKVLKAQNPNATIDDVSFFHNKFLGIYDDSLVAVFYGGQYHGEFPDVEEEYEIGGLTFRWSMGYPILVWNDGEIYELEQAFTQNLLTATNLITIHELYYSES
ncbi:MAG: hypothetical protein WDA65_08485 [Christensenellales bacterium]